MTAELALATLRAGHPEDALALLETDQSVSLDASHHAARGMVLLASGRQQQALHALRTAIALGDGEPDTLLNLALAEDGAGDPERARRLISRLEQLLPNWDEPPLRLAESLRAAGCNADAEVAYRRVLEINPRRQEALIALSGLLLIRHEAAEARELLLRCCGIAPGCAEAWHVLGLALLATGDTGLAHTAFIEAQRLEPAAPEHALRGIEAAFVAGDAEPELARLELAAQDDPLNPVWLLARGLLLAASWEIARRRLMRWRRRPRWRRNRLWSPPGSRRHWSMPNGTARPRPHCSMLLSSIRRISSWATCVVCVLMRMHRYAEARALLLDLLEHHGDSVTPLSNLANASVYQGLHDAAMEAVHRAIALDPDATLPRCVLCNVLPYCEHDGRRAAADRAARMCRAHAIASTGHFRQSAAIRIAS